MAHQSIDLAAKAYAKGEQRIFDTWIEQRKIKDDTRSPIEDDPTIPWRYAVSYAFSQRDGLAKALLGEEAYNEYRRLIIDKTPGIPTELLPYVSRVKMYDGVNKKLKRFRDWNPEKQADYIQAHTMGKPLNTHDRDKLVAMAIVDMFFKDKIGKIKLK